MLNDIDLKIENQLKLALQLDEDERRKTSEMDVGFDSANGTWELIIKYYGDIRAALLPVTTDIIELLQGYAIIRITQDKVEKLSLIPEVIYVEKPKKLFFQADFAANISCIEDDFLARQGLSGKGVIVAVIDSGIDYTHPEFLDADSKTRILEIYDENTRKIYTREEINEAITAGEDLGIFDAGGHGTHVASIAAGSSIGVARESELLIVKLGNDEYYNSARLMEAVDYVIRRSAFYGMPVAINISNGNNYGAHDGDSLLETYLNEVAGVWKNVIVVGSGNEAAKGIHTAGILDNSVQEKEIIIGEFEQNLDVQIWKNYVDDIRLFLRYPNGEEVELLDSGTVTKLRYADTEIVYLYGFPSPYSVNQEIYIQFIAVGDFLNSGIYTLILKGVEIKDGKYDMWLPANTQVSRNTSFVTNEPDVTLTIPSTAYKVITVGAYDQKRQSYADFSGRGYTRNIQVVKPDIVAPGVEVRGAKAGGGYTFRSGTSMAAPFVTGSAALLMEWGIVKEKDVFLYGEKVKAQLIKGARRLAGTEMPDKKTGWGALCFQNSIHKTGRWDYNMR